ncbi:MAG: hypothetical protein HN509_15050 [Halobacteriovoraceae bacterium]|nr:hypothetical protein [Halobacteriovoraceae bacterium]MBT5093361.1 hypothetical protein [Halobacteriovoraceae bacterium]
MKKLIFITLLTLFSLNLVASEVSTLKCQNEDKGITFIKTKTENSDTLNGIFLEDLIPADFCDTKEELSDILAANISDLENVQGACVSITTNGGDGELAILRLIEGQFKAEFKTILVEEPSKAKGQLLDCK